jgi:hypothetical protein
MLYHLVLYLAIVGTSPTYAQDIEPIIRKHCVACHQEGEAGPMSLTDYKSVSHWAPMICEVLEEGRMPPWGANPKIGDFVNTRIVPDCEKLLLRAWVEADRPSGDLSTLKPFEPHKSEWHRKEPPDIVLSMPEPFEVPATGIVEYQYFTVDPHLEHDVWVRDVELSPSNRKVVHHAGVMIQPPKDTNLPPMGFGDIVIAGYLPGAQFQTPQASGTSSENPWGFKTGMVIPAGSKIVFQMHYAPVGSRQADRSKLGLWLCDESEVDRIAVAENIIALDMVIPPQSERTEISRSAPTFHEPIAVYAMNVHMHLRGKSFQFIAHYPDNTQEILLDVPRYNFDWQDTYLLKEPKVLPAGTRVEAVGLFDNSDKNPRNPDPSKEVHWGEQTGDEMMFGGLITFVPRDKYLAARRKSVGSQPSAGN